VLTVPWPVTVFWISSHLSVCSFSWKLELVEESFWAPEKRSRWIRVKVAIYTITVTENKKASVAVKKMC